MVAATAGIATSGPKSPMAVVWDGRAKADGAGVWAGLLPPNRARRIDTVRVTTMPPPMRTRGWAARLADARRSGRPPVPAARRVSSVLVGLAGCTGRGFTTRAGVWTVVT